ncbi:MAG TPA: EI24 domain-containing protein [Telluria sp.]|nr:EI24 domain-containing protein [Telluria sp.]
MRGVAVAYGRALVSQFSARMLALSVVPFLLSLALWGAALWFGWQPVNDWLHAQFAEHGLFRASGNLLASFGMGALKALVVPLLAMLMLLPLMILTALLFMGVAAMPAIARHVAGRWHPDLERRRGGSLWGGVLAALGAGAVFVAAFVLTLPLYALPPLAVAVHVVLWAWLTARVVSYDALADHADPEERDAIQRVHRWPLLVMGLASGAAGALPGIVWVGGTVLSVVFFPFLAAVSIWLYVVIFIFTGLWFEHYCLQALAEMRSPRPA